MKADKILLDHGSGGKMSHRLTANLLLPAFDNPALAMLDDGATLRLAGGRIAFSTDTYVVDPIFFPAAASATWPSTGRSTTWPCAAPPPCT